MQPEQGNADIIFYDGTCGLCHRWVQWVLARDPEGIFHFAPLQSEMFQKLIPVEFRAMLPDSVVVRTQNGQLLTRSSAALYVVDRLNVREFWRVLASITRLIPKPIRDFFYDAVARVRYRIFGRSDKMCPVLPPELRGRFLS
jgi:predicted DCC family thiol-disulfide oxidoreductase YuxK